MEATVKTEYWCAKPIEEIAAAIEEKFADHKKWARETGYLDRVETAYRAYYGFDNDGTLRVSRDQDDVSRINVNHYKSLVRRLHILVTENKLAFQAQAKNSDSKSQIQSDLSRGICEHYSSEKNMHGTLSLAVEGALIQLEQWVHCPWDFAEGYELTVDGQKVVKSGDQMFEVFGPFDVARSTVAEKSQWHIVRKKVCKHDEAALHPEFRDEILSDSISPDVNDLQRSNIRGFQDDQRDDDYCYKYILYHARTPAMEQGRHVEVIAGQVLADGPLRYDTVPLFRISAGDVIGTVFGDSPAIELLPLQEALNAIFSGTLTNNLNHAKQLIYSADPNLTTRELGNGQTLVTAAQPPTGLNLTNSAPENYKSIDLLVNHQQLLSGVNDVARGNPSSNLKSGSSLAIVLAQAIQYVSNLQKSYARVAGEVGTCLIKNIQKFADEEMTAVIVGASRKGQVKKFKRQDIIDVERVTVDLGNPMVQTLAGRNELITAWQQYGIVKDPKVIVNFLRTGEIDSATEDDFSDSVLIREENEMLRKGIKPTALITDNHAEHITKMKAIMSSPEARANPKVLEAWMAHAQEHIDLMRQVPPDLAAILSGQPLPPPPQPAGASPNPPNQPTINGARMPSLPPGTPASSQVAYDQVLENVPPEQAQGF